MHGREVIQGSSSEENFVTSVQADLLCDNQPYALQAHQFLSPDDEQIR